jgi:hypothetical protein
MYPMLTTKAGPSMRRLRDRPAFVNCALAAANALNVDPIPLTPAAP